MSRKEYIFNYTCYANREELPSEDCLLVERAIAACETAYAPYSSLQVGAALRFEDGEVLSSSNQESEVLPSGICAERGLLYYVQANYPKRRIVAMALAATPAPQACSPCGACRQVIVDTERRQGAPIRLILSGERGVTVVDSAESLLPFPFKL